MIGGEERAKGAEFEVGFECAAEFARGDVEAAGGGERAAVEIELEVVDGQLRGLPLAGAVDFLDDDIGAAQVGEEPFPIDGERFEIGPQTPVARGGARRTSAARCGR